jgi:hypothetical protein
MCLQERSFYKDEPMSAKEMSFVATGDAQSFTPEPGMKRQILAHSDQLMLVRHHFEKGWTHKVEKSYECGQRSCRQCEVCAAAGLTEERALNWFGEPSAGMP